ncbi:MAG: hypothetical protein RIC84_08695 [Aggregatilineales bacterium]
MEFSFTPHQDSQDIDVPFIEDARADFAPYYDIRSKTVADAQREMMMEMSKLGAMVTQVVAGAFESDGMRRHGFEIRFFYDGVQGMMRVAGLPMRSHQTDTKIAKVQIQALLNVRDWAKSAVTAKVFSPGHDPLIGHILLPDGSGRTIADYVRTQKHMPMLSGGSSNGIVIEK